MVSAAMVPPSELHPELIFYGFSKLINCFFNLTVQSLNTFYMQSRTVSWTLLCDVSYVSFHRQDSTYHIVYYTSCAALVRNSSVEGRKEENVLFNDAQHILFCGYMVLNTIMLKNHSDGLLFSISSKGSFTCTIPQIG